MEDAWIRFWSDMVARTSGPMWFRLVLQPLVAVFFGVRAGLRDASIVTDRVERRDYRGLMFHQAWTDLGKVTLVALVLDVIVQVLVLGTVYPGETLFVVFAIVVVPYQIIRSVVARLPRGRRPSGTG
jgi:hypothetical protein